LFPPPPPPDKPATPEKYEEPPEEDETLSTSKVYTFNPLQAKKEIEVGNFQMTRGNYKGAAGRFREATLWDDGNSEAFYKLGDANEKLKNYSAAREAFTKYTSLVTDKKKVAEVEKRIAKYPVEDVQPKDTSHVTLDEALKEDEKDSQAARSKGMIQRRR
jgi:tetratricopeptide (TPR) repeat protein